MPSYVEAFPGPGAEPARERLWAAPPGEVIAGLVPWGVPLVVADRVAVVLERMQVYPSGLAFVIRGVLRAGESPDGGLAPFFWEDRDSDRALRVGVEYADGRRALDRPWTRPPLVNEPSAPFLMERGGRGDDRSFERDYWVWGAPPPGAVTVTLDWPALSIAGASAVIGQDALAGAQSHIRRIWGQDR